MRADDTSKLENALMYARKGWRVFPLHSMRDGLCSCGKSDCGKNAAKHPRIAQWQHDATIDEHQIRQWWKQWPDANIGITTGKESNLIVIDIDTRHGGSIEAVERMNVNGELPNTMRVKTGSGGWHLYFTCLRGMDIGSSAGIAPGIDVRGEGGYIVAPPSNHLLGGQYVMDNPTNPAVLPIVLANNVLKAKRERRSETEELETIPEGQRNSTLASMAGRMRQAGFSEGEILAALLVANKDRCTPPLDDSEVEGIAGSISRYEPGEIKKVEVQAGPAIKSLSDIMAMEIPETRWTIPGILPEGTTILAGKPKMGKSWMVLELALAIASGGEALGGVPVESGDVLYLALEDNDRRIQSRVRKLLHDRPIPHKVEVATEWRRLDNGGSSDLRAWLERHPGARLIIVDTLAMVRPIGKSNAISYQEDYAAIRMLKQLSDEYHVAVLVVHHLRKADADDPLDTLNGSTGIGGAVDGYMILKRTRGQADAVLIVGGRDIQDKELAMKFDENTAQWKMLGDASTYRMNEDERKIVELLSMSKEPMSPKAIATRLGKDYDATRQMVSRMAKEGTIKSISRGLYTSVTSVTMVTNGSPSGLNGQKLSQSLVTMVSSDDCDTCDGCDDCDGCDQCDKKKSVEENTLSDIYSSLSIGLNRAAIRTPAIDGNPFNF